MSAEAIERTSDIEIESQDGLIQAMASTLADVRQYFSGDTTTPSRTDGSAFHPHNGCACCEDDLTADIDRVLASPMAPATVKELPQSI